MASVTLRGLAKTYDPGGTQAVADLSLDVRDGEFFVLLGPSGCGKTTVLRCIAGLETPSAGEIRIGDRDVTQLSPGERDVAMVFQSHALYPHLSAWGNIAFGLEVRGVPAAEIARRVEQAAQRLGLTGALERRPGALSGGERQRVALARAIVREPHVFLYDEPLAHLDPTQRGELRAELLELHRALGVTVVYVTHDQVEAMTMGQRIAVLAAGRLRQLGSPAEVYGDEERAGAGEWSTAVPGPSPSPWSITKVRSIWACAPSMCGCAPPTRGRRRRRFAWSSRSGRIR